MLKQLQHKLFETASANRWMLDDQLSLTRCYGYVLANQCIETIGSEDDRVHQRPDCVLV
jgi:hypothetical protein